ncbi:Hint domain-containing protein [Myxosarcina sp. GI1]|uniref:Hint domain-containing protein n=1 Tax=Myxosarcina sp. GI1 TaxID=1541065 RepID=UPI00068B4B67|nr:Hint domain-containing protein [Myxosarcina sp. GI1]
MKNFLLLIKLSITLLWAIVIFSCVAVEPAYSRGGGGGGCFGKETLILTPDGNKSIAQLHPGDRVVNYSFAAHHQDRGTIGKIEVINASDYYLINNKTKVTATHPVYVKTNEGIELKKVQNLNTGDRLINLENLPITISSIEHIKRSLSVYNLMAIEPNNNFYADGFLVHNKGGSGGGGIYGYRGTRNKNLFTSRFPAQKHFSTLLLKPSLGSYLIFVPSNGKAYTIQEKPIQGIIILLVSLFTFIWQFLFKILFFILSSFIALLFLKKVSDNLIRFFSKKFTDNSELIEFTINVNSNFKNKYSVWYVEDDQIWKVISPQIEISESEYSQKIDKTELIERVSNLFWRYQHDWTVKDFESMSEYVVEPFYSRQKRIFKENFGNNCDIVYDCKLSEIIPLKFETKNEQFTFRVQINAEMVNFKLSAAGYVLSGKADPRAFSEYWDVGLDAKNNLYLIKIMQVNKT